MNFKKSRRGIGVKEATQREILRKQMELLAEASAADYSKEYLPVYSKEIVRIHKELSKPIRIAVFSFAFLNLFVYFFVFIKKFCWSKG